MSQTWGPESIHRLDKKVIMYITGESEVLMCVFFLESFLFK